MDHIQLSGEHFSCFVPLPIEIKHSTITESLMVISGNSTFTFDLQTIKVNEFGPAPTLKGVR